MHAMSGKYLYMYLHTVLYDSVLSTSLWAGSRSVRNCVLSRLYTSGPWSVPSSAYLYIPVAIITDIGCQLI